MAKNVLDTENLDLLWTNPNPSASFAAQTLTINKLKNYSFYFVATSDGTAVGVVGEGAASCAYARGGSNTTIRTRRFWSPSNTQIQFEAGYAGWSVDNTNCRPTKIYGLKNSLNG